MCTPACIPSVCHSVAWRWLSTPVQFFSFSPPCAFTLGAPLSSLPLIIFPFLFLKRVNTHHHPSSLTSLGSVPITGTMTNQRTNCLGRGERWGCCWLRAINSGLRQKSRADHRRGGLGVGGWLDVCTRRRENNETVKGEGSFCRAKRCNHPPPGSKLLRREAEPGLPGMERRVMSFR